MQLVTWDQNNMRYASLHNDTLPTCLCRFHRNTIRFWQLKTISNSDGSRGTPTKVSVTNDTCRHRKLKNVPYREAVSSLMYAAVGTRPDIAFATSTVAQFLESPGWIHWEAVKRIFQYLKGMRNLSLVYGEKKEDLQGWVGGVRGIPCTREFQF